MLEWKIVTKIYTCGWNELTIKPMNPQHWPAESLERANPKPLTPHILIAVDKGSEEVAKSMQLLKIFSDAWEATLNKPDFALKTVFSWFFRHSKNPQLNENKIELTQKYHLLHWFLQIK